jgi:signal transduction histidine kinase
MRTRAAWRDVRANRPVAFEVGAGIAGGVLVLLITLAQWGLSPDGVLRAVTLALWLGIVVWLLARRRRVAEERARRALGDQRLQLARELHDAVAGQVAVIGIQAAAARRVLATSPDEAEDALERIETVSRAANADLRRMLVALRGDAGSSRVAEPGLADLESLVRSFGDAGAAVTLAVTPGALPAADGAVDRAAYRIVAEALANARRHAGAVPVAVGVRREGPALVVEVVNGPAAGGASVAGDTDQVSSRPEAGSGLGLAGIRERAAILGGSAEAGPTADGGFAVRVRLPAGVRW